MSRAMRANDVLQDSARIGNSVPPQVCELASARPVCGGVKDDSTGYDGESTVTTPNFRPVEPVTTLKVEPGKNRSWYEVAISGLLPLSGWRKARASLAAVKSWEAKGFGSYDG
jgi:hypothetical protein